MKRNYTVDVRSGEFSVTEERSAAQAGCLVNRRFKTSQWGYPEYHHDNIRLDSDDQVRELISVLQDYLIAKHELEKKGAP